MMDFVFDLTLYVLTAAFISGFLITVLGGSARGIKILLIALSVIFTLVVIPGFIVTRGLLIFLILQLISMLIIIFMFIIVGAVTGASIYHLIHKKKNTNLDQGLIHEYISLVEFSEKKGITEERTLARIKSGYYLGGLYEGNWYVHHSELSDAVLKNP